MRESQDGLPELGPHARKLGVRPGDATTPDVQAIQPDDIVTFGEGMSVAPNDPANFERHRRPPSLGGTGRDPVWYIDEVDLGGEIAFHQDNPGHGVLTPQQPMDLKDLKPH
jgi:hypothetical protein